MNAQNEGLGPRARAKGRIGIGPIIDLFFFLLLGCMEKKKKREQKKKEVWGAQ